MAGRDDDSWGTGDIPVPGEDPEEPTGHTRPGDPHVVRAAEARDSAAPPPRISRRQRRQTLTFLLSFGLIVLLGLVALAAYFGKVNIGVDSGKPTALPTCPTVSATVQAFGDTSVVVLNASSRNGLATTVMRELQRRGFKVPSPAANAPSSTKVTTMALIKHGPNGSLAAHTVASVVAGAVTYVQDDRIGSDVDLILGPTFALKPVATPSATVTQPAAKATCTPADQ